MYDGWVDATGKTSYHVVHECFFVKAHAVDYLMLALLAILAI